MMAKCYYTLWFVVFGIVGIIYILQMYERGLKDEEKEEKKEMIEEGKKYLSGLTLVLTVVGFLMYMGAKKLEYKDKFKYITFLFGKPNCKGNDYNKDKDIGYLNILKHSID